MGVYIYQNNSELAMKNAYIGEYIPMSGLLGYRPLQTDLKDLSGNGNDGTWYSGTGSFEIASGKTGARVTQTIANYRTLTTQHIITPVTYNSGPVTLFGWICFNSIDNISWHGLMTNNNAGTGWIVGTRSPDGNRPTVSIDTTSLRISSSAPSTNTWYFWCGTSDGTTIKTYLNGTLANTGTVGAATAGTIWKLGCAQYDSNVSNNNGTDGWVRQCGIYNRAISDAEVSAIYTATA